MKSMHEGPTKNTFSKIYNIIIIMHITLSNISYVGFSSSSTSRKEMYETVTASPCFMAG